MIYSKEYAWDIVRTLRDWRKITKIMSYYVKFALFEIKHTALTPKQTIYRSRMVKPGAVAALFGKI